MRTARMRHYNSLCRRYQRGQQEFRESAYSSKVRTLWAVPFWMRLLIVVTICTLDCTFFLPYGVFDAIVATVAILYTAFWVSCIVAYYRYERWLKCKALVIVVEAERVLYPCVDAKHVLDDYARRGVR